MGQALPAELLIPRGDNWQSCAAEIFPVAEYHQGRPELSYRIQLAAETAEEISPGSECMVTFVQEGETILFNSLVLAVEGDTIYVRIPQAYSPDRRKRRLEFSIPGQVEVDGTTFPVDIINISEDWNGLGIQSHESLPLREGVQLLVEFTFNGQVMAYLGRVVWSVNKRRFGLVKRELHIW